MLICGEKLNSSFPEVAEAIRGRDAEAIIRMVQSQAANGADFLDINAGMTGKDETESLLWIADFVIKHTDCGLMFDSADPAVLYECLHRFSGSRVIVNSITNDKKYHPLIKQIADTGTGVVCLPMIGSALPETPIQRVETIAETVNQLTCFGIAGEMIYIDPLVYALATDITAAQTALCTLRLYKEKLPHIKTICGLSNISAGLPHRPELNAAFLTMMLAEGLDAAILDITSERIRKSLYATQALLEKDENCLTYIRRLK